MPRPKSRLLLASVHPQRRVEEEARKWEEVWARFISGTEMRKQEVDRYKAAHLATLFTHEREKRVYAQVVEWRKTVEKDAEWKVATYGPDMFARHLADSFDALLASL